MQRRQSLSARIVSSASPTARNRLRSAVEALEVRRLFATLTVNTADDNTASDSFLTLREAIEVINRTIPISSLGQAMAQVDTTTGSLGNNDMIDFNIPGSGVQDLAVNSNLPTITNPVTIDGYSQPGTLPATGSSNATILIELDGQFISSGGDGLSFMGTSGVTVRGLSVVNFNDTGITINDLAGEDAISGNYIGVLPNGIVVGANGAGLSISNAQDVTIGGETPADRNIISGNTGGGVLFPGADDGDVFEGNYVGVDATGDTPLSNGGDGIEVDNVNNLTIGGTTSDDRNIISGNIGDGVHFESNDDDDVAEGNYVGLDAAGETAVPNGESGIEVDNVNNLTIGGTDIGAGNVVSGNVRAGISFDASSASSLQGDVVEGNYIGTDAAGMMLGVPNMVAFNDSGVQIQGGDQDNTISTDITIGGSVPAQGTSSRAIRESELSWCMPRTTRWRGI